MTTARQNIAKQLSEADDKTKGLKEMLDLQMELFNDAHVPETELICYPGYFPAGRMLHSFSF